MKRKNILFTAVSIALLSLILLCLIINDEWNVTGRVSFTVDTEEKRENISTWSDGENREYVFLPSYADLESVYFQIEPDEHFAIDGIEVHDGMSCANFEIGESYALTYDNDGREYTKELTFLQSSNVATMFIDTASGKMDYVHSKKENKEECAISIYSADGHLDYSEGDNSISGRGNSTWDNFEKKPYSISLQNEANILNMGAAKKWILLANMYDPTHIRNKMIFDFASEFGLMYSPDSQWIDLYLNGEYAGLYLLCERNEVHRERVAIAENGSFLISAERKERLDSANRAYFMSNAGQALRIHFSDENVDVARKIQSVENAIISENGIDEVTRKEWTELIDVDSWARKYLIEEVFANEDGAALSQFFFLDGADSSKKVYAGPVWDYDITAGSENNWQIWLTDIFYANRPKVKNGLEIPWNYSLYKKEEFYNRVLQIYQTEFLPAFYDLCDQRIDEYVDSIKEAVQVDGIRWNVQIDHNTAIDQLLTFLKSRITFLSELWLEGYEYSMVNVYPGQEMHNLYIPIMIGKQMISLPQLEDTEYYTFDGWYYSNTDEPFDETAPITEDTEIYAKWEDTPANRVRQIMKLIPLGVIAVIGCSLLTVELSRTRRGRRTCRQ